LEPRRWGASADRPSWAAMTFPEARRLPQLLRAGPGLHQPIRARPEPARPLPGSAELAGQPPLCRAAGVRRHGAPAACSGRHRAGAEGQQAETRGKLCRRSHPPPELPEHPRRPEAAWAGASGACRCSGPRQRFGSPAGEAATAGSEEGNKKTPCCTDVVARAKTKGRLDLLAELAFLHRHAPWPPGLWRASGRQGHSPCGQPKPPDAPPCGDGAAGPAWAAPCVMSGALGSRSTRRRPAIMPAGSRSASFPRHFPRQPQRVRLGTHLLGSEGRVSLVRPLGSWLRRPRCGSPWNGADTDAASVGGVCLSSHGRAAGSWARSIGRDLCLQAALPV